MNYILKLGVLYEENFKRDLAKIKSILIGAEKNIYTQEKEWIAKTNIRNRNNENYGDVRFREYVLMDKEGEVIALGYPDYAKEENPDEVGWPATRVPKVDHAEVYIGEKKYILEMQNSRNYKLKNCEEETVLQVVHKGICGGWNLEVKYKFPPEIICGIFLFCRYMEQENELLII